MAGKAQKMQKTQKEIEEDSDDGLEGLEFNMEDTSDEEEEEKVVEPPKTKTQPKKEVRKTENGKAETPDRSSKITNSLPKSMVWPESASDAEPGSQNTGNETKLSGGNSPKVSPQPQHKEITTDYLPLKNERRV